MGTEDKLYNKIKHAAENAQQKDFPGMDKVWARVEEKLETNVAKKETSIWKKIAVAASIVLVATIGYQFYTNTNSIATPQIVNEVKIEPLESNEVLVESAPENQIISTEEADVILNKPINEAVVITSTSEKKPTIYPEEISLMNNDEVITYVRADKKDKTIVVKEEVELLPFGKEHENQLIQSGHYNFVSTNAPKYTATKDVKREQFESDTFSTATSNPSKKSAPSVVIDGDYYCALGKEGSHFIEYKLTLNQDGTFIFHSYSNNKQGIPNEVNKYGKGKWTIKNNIITFLSNKEKDFDEKYTLDFNNSKARFVTKSPRDKTDQIVKTRVVFLESEIFWMNRIEMLKM
jgi:hypothetical protein